MTEVQRAFGDAVWEFLLLLQWLGDPVAGEEAEQGELEHVGRPWVLHVRRSREEEKIPLQWELLEQQEKLSNSTYWRNIKGFPSGSVVKDPPAKQEMWV